MEPAVGVAVPNNGAAIPDVISQGLQNENALAGRHQRKNLFNKELVFEFTRDPALLHQYYKIRGNGFRSDLGALSYPVTESESDRNAHVLIIRQGNFCIGGGRLHFRNPKKVGLLPIEIEGFRLETHFPELRHKQMNYCQVGAIALLPEFRGGEITVEMFRRLHSKAVAFNVDIMFAMAPKINARLHRQICNIIGLKETKIHHDIELPIYPHLEEVKQYLVSIITNKPLVRNPTGLMSGEKESYLEHSVTTAL